jgi:hypothetical protein
MKFVFLVCICISIYAEVVVDSYHKLQASVGSLFVTTFIKNNNAIYVLIFVLDTKKIIIN